MLASVYLFVCECVWVCLCLPAIVKEHNPIRMMAAVINLIRGPLGFAVCQSDIWPSCHLNSIAAFDGGAPLTCNLSSVGSCAYLKENRFFIFSFIIVLSVVSVLGCVNDKNYTSQDGILAVECKILAIANVEKRWIKQTFYI